MNTNLNLTDLRLVRIVKIEFDQRDHHTIGYIRKVEAWMKQWTVANNYSDVVIVGDDYDAAVRAWHDDFRHALGLNEK